MPSIYEPARVFWWLDVTLTAIAEQYPAEVAGVWRGAAPSSADANKIVLLYDFDAGDDVDNASAVRLWHRALYLVKVTGPRTLWDTTVAVSDQVDDALQLKGGITIGPAQDVRLMRCNRESVVTIPDEVVNTVLQSSIGALWRISARSLAGLE